MTPIQRASTTTPHKARIAFAYPILILLTAICLVSSAGCLSVKDRISGLDLNPFDSDEDLEFDREENDISLDEPYVFDEENFTEDEETVSSKTDVVDSKLQLSESFLEQERRLAERERELEQRERELEEAMAAINTRQGPSEPDEEKRPHLTPDLVAAPLRSSLAPVVNDPPELPTMSSEERLDFARSMVEAHDLALEGDFIESQLLYERIVDGYPDRYEPYHHLAVIADCQKRYGQAIAWYVQAAELEPSNAEILHDLGRCLAQQDRFEDAEKALRRAVEVAPEEPLYRETLAINLAQREQYSNALDELVHVMSEADAYYKIAEILDEKNHEEGVKECLVLALESNPTHSPSLNWLQALAREEEEEMQTSSTISPQSEWKPSYARTSSQRIETMPESSPAPLPIMTIPSEEPQPVVTPPAPLPTATVPESIAIPDFQIPEQRERVSGTEQIEEQQSSGESAFGRSSLYHTRKLSTGTSGWRPRGTSAEENPTEESNPTPTVPAPSPVRLGEPIAMNPAASSHEENESGVVFPLIPPSVSMGMDESEKRNVTLLDTPEMLR
jgi:Tfp pilus assembly protein PilF